MEQHIVHQSLSGKFLPSEKMLRKLPIVPEIPPRTSFVCMKHLAIDVVSVIGFLTVLFSVYHLLNPPQRWLACFAKWRNIIMSRNKLIMEQYIVHQSLTRKLLPLENC